MARPAANLRMFVAIHPPAEHVARLLALLPALDLPPHRITPAAQVHLTVLFVGDVPVRALDATIESVERSAAGLAGFHLRPQCLITLPRRGPSRLVALETDAPPALLEIHRRLVRRLASKVRARPGDRFIPHLTLCRFRPPLPDVRIDRPIELEPFEATRIVLERSTLRPQGAEHHEVAAVELAGSN